MALADSLDPHDEVGSMVSQPSARELPGVSLFRAKVSSAGEASHHRAQAPTAAAVPNKPACPAMPPSASQFSSCTAPRRSSP